MNPEDHAAYHGPDWKRREGSLLDDIRAGDGWAPLACRSSWSRLTDVLLYAPGPEIARIDDPGQALHVAPIEHDRLIREHEEIARQYAACGVRVHRIDRSGVDDRRQANLIFTHDLFWQTSAGAVVGRMASPVRAGEERFAARALARLSVPIGMTVGGHGTLEGADCLWLAPGRALCGVGTRTNAQGYEQLRNFLELQGVACESVPVPRHIQHLTGCVQIVSGDRALVRTEQASSTVTASLRGNGFEVVGVAETEEIVQRLAFNFVVVDRDRVILPARCPRFRSFLNSVGIEVVAEVPISQYANAAGGLSCATGVLGRSAREDPHDVE